MMKVNHGTRYTALMLAMLLMLGLLAGCSDAEQPAPTPDNTAQTDTMTNNDQPDDAAPDDAPADDSAGTESDDWLPLVDEPTHLSMWIAFTDPIDPDAMDPSYNEPYKIVEQQTGVIIDFNAVSSAAGDEQFSLMMASENWSDIVGRGHSRWPGGVLSCVDQEILMDVSDLITGGYAPHYQALREADHALASDTMDDGGVIAGFFRVLTRMQSAWAGLYTSRALAEEEGFNVDEITSLSDWEAMLTAFAARDDVTTAYELTASGLDSALLSTFNISSGENFQVYFRHVGDKVECSYTSDDYYNYLKLCRSWIDKGIINPNFYGESPACWNMDVVATGDIATFRGMGSQGQLLNAMNETRDYVAMPSPLLDGVTARSVIQCAGTSSRAEDSYYAITAACSNPELAVRWCDYFFSDGVLLLANYGIEGVTYTLEDGKPVFTDLMLNPPDNKSWENMIYHYGLKWSFPCLYKWDAQFEGQDENTLRAYSDMGFDKFYSWDEDMYTLPLHMSLTQQENEKYTSTFSDIQTYINEMAVKFLTGDVELSDASWADYKANIEKMRIADCESVLQAAYERYQQR